MLRSMLMGGSNTNPVRAEDVSGRMPEPPVPKGCKLYFFDAKGYYSTEKMLSTECVFKCAATTPSNAVRKFNNWKSKQK